MQVPKEKLSEYLLNELHPDGGSKAKFFIHVAGFDRSKLNDFERFLVSHYQNGKVMSEIITPFGTKIVKESNVVSPNGKSFVLRSVWMLEERTRTCNLVTAYPI